MYIYNLNLVDGTNTDLFINDIRSVNYFEVKLHPYIDYSMVDKSLYYFYPITVNLEGLK